VARPNTVVARALTAAPQRSLVPGFTGIQDASNSFSIGGAVRGGIDALAGGGSITDIVAGGLSGGLGGGGGTPSNMGQTLVGGDQSVPGSGGCPGLTSVRINGVCVNIADALPGGDPLLTGQVPDTASSDGYGAAVKGMYGVGLIPRVEVRSVRLCPKGMALGDDGVCYKGLGRNSPRRAWPMGMKPLLTPGDRAAIRKAEQAAKSLARAKKSINATSKALARVC